ncbi:hypothetical protein [Lysinibacillus sp. G4S2]|uniref:hypothetical protein n=1 Tax=Lysinibacillus sp. G4S2 TaxID=3055859 RepID=UPI0025A18CB1|nr:hypothetical protein [Lysinibacillus sp. G4S2]MDM5250306.1 hypothetical protein [Lysinibacillus sp. G4S2]
MDQQKQMTMYDFLSVQESDHGLFVDRKTSTAVNKSVDKKKYKGASKGGYIVRG